MIKFKHQFEGTVKKLTIRWSKTPKHMYNVTENYVTENFSANHSKIMWIVNGIIFLMLLHHLEAWAKVIFVNRQNKKNKC